MFVKMPANAGLFYKNEKNFPAKTNQKKPGKNLHL